MQNINTSKIKWFAWFIFSLGAAFYCYEFLLRVLPSIVVGDLATYFSLDAKQVGLLSAMYYVAYVPMQLVAGVLLDRYSTKWLLILACFLCAVGTVLFVITDSVLVAGIARFIIGFGSAFAYVGSLKLATLWLEPRHFAFVVGLTNALGMFGAMIADEVLTPIVQHAGVNQAFYYCAMAGFLITALLMIFVKPVSKSTSPDKQKVTTPLVSWKHLIQILARPRMWLVGVIGCLLYLPQTGFSALWGVTFIEKVYQATPQQAANAISFLLVGFIIGAPVLGEMASRYGRKKLQLILGASVSATAFFIIVLFPGMLTLWWLSALLFVVGFSFASQIQVFVLAKESVPLYLAATSLAIVNMIIMMGGVLSQPLIGALVDRVAGSSALHHAALVSEGFQQAMLVIPIGLALGAVLSCFLKETPASTS